MSSVILQPFIVEALQRSTIASRQDIPCSENDKTMITHGHVYRLSNYSDSAIKLRTIRNWPTAAPTQ